MDIVEAVGSRKSVRGFKPDLVPRAVLEEILETARHAPSVVNTQPWEITIITGQVLDSIKQGNTEMALSGATPHGDIPFPFYEGTYKQRQIDLAIALFGLMGIAREDKEKRAQWSQRNYRFHEAPVGIILSLDKSLDNSLLPLVDIGTILQTICLVALNYGLATCIDYLAVIFPEVIRRFTGIPESKRIVTAIAIGYPDWSFPGNKIESKREPIENFTTWCGFD